MEENNVAEKDFLTEEQIEALGSAIEAVAEIVNEIAKIVVPVMVDVYNRLKSALFGAVTEIAMCNKRCVHLALHGRTKRIRAKNIHRICRKATIMMNRSRWWKDDL